MGKDLTTVVRSATKTVEINRDKPTVVIGERINPTGRKQVLAAFQAGDFSIARADALAQVEAGADMLDVNAGVPGADEPVLLVQVLQTVMAATDVPLCIDTADPESPGCRAGRLWREGPGQFLQRRGALAERRPAGRQGVRGGCDRALHG